MAKLTHVDENGKACMVDVSSKPITFREATASGCVRMKAATLGLILSNNIKKGDVLGVARIAGIMSAKKVGEIIPLCHPLNITSITISFEPDEENSLIKITAVARISSHTGVEMEALTAVSVAALTIYDMCKAADKGIVISDIMLLKKTGGKSGEYVRDGLLVSG